MAKTFVLHDETVNTYGFRMLTSGADLTEFRRNPVMLLDHNDWNLPIGRWENVRVEDGRILADAVFDMKDPRAAQVAGKVEDGFIRAASIGAWPPEEVSDAVELRYPGQTGVTVMRWKVREASVVSIGANHNALAFYDRKGKPVNMKDGKNIIQLFDRHNFNSDDMKLLAGILNLADTSTENDVASAVRTLIGDRDRLKAENVTLKGRIDKINADGQKAKKEEAVSLVDAAVKDGRIDAKAKDSYLKLFDSDFESAKTALEAVPARQSVAGRIEQARVAGSPALADMEKMSWDELDRAEKLTELKDHYPEVYAAKFKGRFGVELKG
ncbi:MAG: hypothetical protein LBL42_04265 [Tannerella sp.]|jgi:hypothetical protein|nr:hypothetical protein [Tannerella sp.]